MFGLFGTRDYGAAWNWLHPTDQKLISRARYVQCMHSSLPYHLLSFRTLAIREDPVQLPGIPQTTSKAVTFTMRIAFAGRAAQSVTMTKHAIRLSSRWAWFFSPAQMVRVSQGACP
jgi:hypothetical protein